MIKNGGAKMLRDTFFFKPPASRSILLIFFFISGITTSIFLIGNNKLDRNTANNIASDKSSNELMPSLVTNPYGPLGNGKEIGQSSELILIMSQGTSDAVSQKLFDFDTTVNGNTQNQLKFTDSLNETGASNGIYGNKAIDVVIADFNNDGYEEYVSVWEGLNKTINIVVPVIDHNTMALTITNLNRVTSQRILSGEDNGRVHVAAGDFYGNGRNEFVLAYKDSSDHKIHLELYNVSDKLMPSYSGHSYTIPNTSNERFNFDITAGDFNNDGKDELAFVHAKLENSPLYLRRYIKIISANSTEGFIPHNENMYYGHPYEFPDSSVKMNLNITKARLDYSGADQLAVLDHYTYRNSGHIETDANLVYINISSDLESQSNTGETDINPNPSEDLQACSIASGDLNLDGISEIAVMKKDSLYIFSSTSSLIHPVRKKTIGNYYITNFPETDNDKTYNFLNIGCMHTDTSNASLKSVVLVAQNVRTATQQIINITGLEFDSSLTNFTLKIRKTNIVQYNNINQNAYRHFAIGMGDFNGDRIRLGNPGLPIVKYDIPQSIIELNATAVHFDVFGDSTFDINGQFNSGTTPFISKYIYDPNYRDILVEPIRTDIHADWGMSADVQSGPLLYIQTSKSLKAKYGDGFSNIPHSVFSEGITISTYHSDLYFEAFTDYKIWEYPLYAYGNLKGNIAVIIPEQPVFRWESSRTRNWYNTRPEHQYGNILSYLTDSEYSTNDSNYLYKMSEIQLEPKSPGPFEVSVFFDTIPEHRITHRNGLELGSQVNGFGIEVNIDGYYNDSEFSTFNISLGNRLTGNYLYQGTHLYENIGQTNYVLSGHLYWGENGALALNFGADPNIPANGGSWWNRYRGKTDPTFILSYLQDSLKGDPPPGENKYKTFSIWLSPGDPQPGDTVYIKANIHNFTVSDPVTVPVTVRFYSGDPDSGGTPIPGLNGNFVNTIPPIPARNFQTVTMPFIWDSFYSKKKLYAKLDSIPNEVHTNNNKGWNYFISPSVGINETITNVPEDFSLAQNYPNPFNPTTNIEYVIPKSTFVKIQIFDILGRELTTLVNEFKNTGKYSVTFNGINYSSGVYFYKMDAEEFSLVKRMVLIK